MIYAEPKDLSALLHCMIQGVFDVAASPHIVINQRELIVQYNKAAEDAFGYSKEEMVTQYLSYHKNATERQY